MKLGSGIWIALLAAILLGRSLAVGPERPVVDNRLKLDLRHHFPWERRPVDVYYQGEPVSLSIFLYFPEAKTASNRAHNAGLPAPPAETLRARIAPPGRGWAEYLSVRLVRKGWLGLHHPVNFDWRSSIRPLFRSWGKADQIGATPLHIPFNIPPSFTETLAPASYSLQADFDNRSGPAAGIRERVSAEVVTFRIEPKPVDPGKWAAVLIRQSDLALSVEPDGRKAAELALQATHLAPGNPGAWRALTYAASRSRDWPAVIAAASRFLQIAPPDPPTGSPDRAIVGSLLRRARRQIELERAPKASPK